MKKKDNSKQNCMTGKASWERVFILANPVIHLLWNIKSSVLSLKWQSPSSNTVSAPNQKKSWWGCEEAKCSTKLVSASAFHLGMQHSSAQVTKYKSTVPGKKPCRLTPSFTAVCLNHLCVLNSPRRSLVSLGGIQWAHRHPIWARDPAVPGTCVLSLSAFLPSQGIQSCFSTCPQPSGW